MEAGRQLLFAAAGESKVSVEPFCIIPINAKYYSDSVAVIPIMEYIII